MRSALSERISSLAQERRRIEPIHFARPKRPEVSVLLLTDGERAAFSALSALRQHGDGRVLDVTVLVRDAHPATARFLSSCTGIETMDARGLPIGDALNAAAAKARGRYLCFLDGVRVRPGWLHALIESLDERTVAAASQIRTPANEIVEAGCGFGAGLRFGDPRTSYVRDLHCTSLRSLLVDARRFAQTGGFPPGDDPLACGRALCAELAAQHLRVVYQPESVVTARRLHRGPTSATSGLPEGTGDRGTILVIDDIVPLFDRSAGGKRMFALCTLMRELGYRVIYVPDDGGEHQPYTRALQQVGVEVRYRWNGRTPLQDVASLDQTIDIAWLSRPQIAEKYVPLVRAAGTKHIIYDTVDLHYRRTGSARMRDLELHLARACDRTVVTTDAERAILLSEGIADPFIVPVVEPERSAVASSPVHRENILFLGNYTHAPNVDAAAWLCADILPLVRADMPHVSLTLAGSEPSAAVRALAGAGVHVTGYVPDLEPFFACHRVFAAPLRYGAGIKGKVVEALAAGLPVVTTPLGAEGIDLIDGVDVCIADDARAFASAITRLYRDDEFWNRIAQGGMLAARRFTPDAVRVQLANALQF